LGLIYPKQIVKLLLRKEGRNNMFGGGKSSGN
jgi:hypothetical protein